MVLKICDRCNQTYNVDPHVDDFVHQCNSGNDNLDNEDVLIVGDWEDYTGSGVVNDTQVPVAGAANKVWGTTSSTRGIKLHTLNDKGNIKVLYRDRQHLEYKDLKGSAK